MKVKRKTKRILNDVLNTVTAASLLVGSSFYELGCSNKQKKVEPQMMQLKHGDDQNSLFKIPSQDVIYKSIKKCLGDTLNTAKEIKSMERYGGVASGIIPFNLVEGLSNYALAHPDKRKEALSLIDEVIEMTVPYKDNYFGEFACMLGDRQRLSRDEKYGKLHEKICENLKNKVVSDINNINNGVFTSDYGTDEWLVNLTGTLHALHDFDEIYDKNISSKPIEDGLKYISKITDEKTGLPFSASGVPVSGSALALIVYNTSFFDQTKAKELWGNFKNNYGRNFLGLRGFGESPKGFKEQERRPVPEMIAPSGEHASGATGLALLASNAVRDSNTSKSLYDSMNYAYFLFGAVQPKLENPLHTLLSQSVIFNAFSLYN